MSPVIILFSIGVWWIVWGMIGAMLAVPLTSVLKIVSSHLIENGAGGPYIHVLNSLLEGRPLDVLPESSQYAPHDKPRRRATPLADYDDDDHDHEP
jgi:uncharacterized membrane protein YedE/YeeE